MRSDEIMVSVIVPTYNEWDKLKHCIAALESQSFPKEKFEVIVVNNNPGCHLPNTMVLPANFKLITEEKPGSYAARNAGLKIAKGDIIGFTDSDCIPDKDWIKNAVEFLHQNTGVSRVAGKINISQKSKQPTIVEKYNQVYSFPQKWLINHGGGSVTANLFTHRHVFDKIGGFDDQLMSMGDRYWGMKAQEAGFPIAYVESVTVFHPSRTWTELVKKEKRHGGAVKPDFSTPAFRLYLEFLYEFRPRASALKYMFGRNRHQDRRLIDRLTLPFLRHYLMLVRAYEKLKIQLGKRPNRT